jgi:hypothetical protein
VLQAKADIGVRVIGLVARFALVGSLERDRFVAIGLRQLDAAIPSAVRHVGAAENDEAGLELLLVGDKGHGYAPCLCSFCA